MGVKVLIVDDHGIMREGLRLLIERQDGMEVIGEAPNGRQAVEFARIYKPDLVIMDVSMPDLNGIEAAKQILNENQRIKILALSAYSNKRFVVDMLKAGVYGYVLKDCLIDELVNAIQAVMSNERYLSTKIAGIVIDDYVRCRGPDVAAVRSSLERLTSKECELLQLLAESKSSKEAARLLHVSVKTVDARRRGIMNKLGISSVVGLTKFAIREGLTSLDF